jgi:hypothetical protein
MFEGMSGTRLSIMAGALWLGALGFTCATCGGAPDDERAAEATSSAERRSREAARTGSGGAARAERPIDPAATGALEVVVRFTGEVRAPAEIDLTTECRHRTTPLQTEALLVHEGLVQNALVYARRGWEGWTLPDPPAQPHVLDQQGCQYLPHVSAMRVGQRLEVKNSDPHAHNVNFRAQKNEPKNPTQSAGSAAVECAIEYAELGIPVECNIHPWMRAWLCVFEHPFFALTDATGRARIAGLPAGTYDLGLWHETLSTSFAGPRHFTIEAGQTAEVTITTKAR